MSIILTAIMGVKMSLYFSANTSISPGLSNAKPTPCTIKGRLIPYEEFLPRLKNFCLSLGFKKTMAMSQEPSPSQETESADIPVSLFTANGITCPAGNDSVIILSTRVPYEPSWGVYGGLPRPLIHERIDRRTDETVSNFIAPYLAQYHFAQKHIYLTKKEAGQYLVTLPTNLLSQETKSGSNNLKIRLDKFTVPNVDGLFVPLLVADSFVSFPISEQFLQHLSDNNFSWEMGKFQRIGALLTAELFSFTETEQLSNSNGSESSKSIFFKTLLPGMNCIVTHANPQLRAAIIHLKSEFSRMVDELLRNKVESSSGNLLCVAGLDIDVAAFKGRGERYFVPWAAYLQQDQRQDNDTNNQLQQDDLFVALMAQEKQCSV